MSAQPASVNPAGTWQVTITAADDATTPVGPLSRRTAHGLIVLRPDAILLSLTPGPGAGSWSVDTRGVLSLDFVELIDYQPDGRFDGHAKVTQRGHLTAAGDAFETSGRGALFAADGTPVGTTATTTRGTRVMPIATPAPSHRPEPASRTSSHGNDSTTTRRVQP